MAIYPDEKRGTYFFICRVPKKGGGTRQVKRRGFATKREARIAEAKVIADAEQGKLEEENVTFEQVAEEYMDWYKRRRKESSYIKISSIVNTHLIPRFGEKQLQSIRARDITKYQDDLIDEYSPAHVKKIHSVLSATFNFAIRQEYTSDNPARIVGNVDLDEDKHINYWTLDEFKVFIKHVDDPLYYALFMTLYYSGMRKGEMLSLTWGDVDFDNNIIDVNKTVYNRKVTKPKTAASIRRIMMPGHVMTLLARLRNERKPKMTYVIFGEFHDHISTTTLDRKYAEFIKASGVKRIRIHDFRHSHASYLINKNIIASVVSARLGHGDVATTLNTYSHLYPSTEKEAVLSMENDFKTAQIIKLKTTKN